MEELVKCLRLWLKSHTRSGQSATDWSPIQRDKQQSLNRTLVIFCEQLAPRTLPSLVGCSARDAQRPRASLCAGVLAPDARPPASPFSECLTRPGLLVKTGHLGKHGTPCCELRFFSFPPILWFGDGGRSRCRQCRIHDSCFPTC